VPYPTSLVASHILEPATRTTAVLVYGAVSVVIALMFNVLWAYAFRNNLVVRGPGADRATSVARGFIIGPLIYLAATLLALVNPFISMAVFAGLAVYWMLPGKIPTG
jgi:uncharacterized membrane protein